MCDSGFDEDLPQAMPIVKPLSVCYNYEMFVTML